MTQEQFVRLIANDVKIQPSIIKMLLRNFVTIATQILSKGGKVYLNKGFTIRSKHKPHKMKFNMNTLTINPVLTHNSTQFIAHPGLKQAVDPAYKAYKIYKINSNFKSNFIVQQSKIMLPLDKLSHAKFYSSLIKHIASASKTKLGISIRNLGTFKAQKSVSRNGRNPRTDATILIPASTRIKFNPSAKLILKLN
jgi:nucleoid DNA-binding protein